MGLTTNIEHWEMSAAIGMATEGVRANYNQGVGGGGFGAADREIASKIDGGKVLAAVDSVSEIAPHLADWSMFAYASPYWNSYINREHLFNHLLHDWVMEWACNGVFIQERTFNRVKALVPIVAGGLALEQSSGAEISERISVEYQSHPELYYHPVGSRALLIAALVEFDCEEKDIISESFMKKRQRYYQNHWSTWRKHIEAIRTLLVRYDQLARKLFKKAIDNQSGAI